AILREKLSGHGRIHLFVSAWMEITEDFANLSEAAKYEAQKRLDDKVAALGRIPRLLPAASEEALSDTKLALARGGAVLDSAPDEVLRAAGLHVDEIPESRRISPLTTLQMLREQGRIRAPVAEAVAKYFARDLETPPLAFAPDLILVRVFFLEI